MPKSTLFIINNLVTQIAFGLYFLAISYLFLYGLSQIRLVWAYLKGKQQLGNLPVTPTDWPFVTVQLPIYNEKYVIKRLFKAISALDYPKNLFEIQILDDSTDETTAIIAEEIAIFKLQNIQCSVLHRTNRTGFKAGALAEGLKVAKGEFIAIFDADFLPKSDFLKVTIPHFVESVGLVQTRWTHTNEHFSALTELQAFGLDAHFSVEQGGRNFAHHCINFNGTAGIWRKQTIADAGGWRDASITEDLDLSYRAQMKGWQFKFVESIECPAELPIEMNAIRSQQFRWTKGAAECAKLLIVSLFKNKKVDAKSKIMGFFHLMNSSGYVLMVWLGLSSFWITTGIKWTASLTFLATLFQINWLILLVFYGVAYQQRYSNNWLGFAKKFTLFMLFMAGLALQNALGVIEAWVGIKTEFIRTPKFNLEETGDRWVANQYVKLQLKPIVWFEILYLFYCCWLAIKTIQLSLWGLLPFYLMIIAGLIFVLYFTISHSFVRKTKTL